MKPKTCNCAFLLITSLIITSTALSGQTKSELEQKRKALQQEINTTQDLLDQTGESREAALTTLETLRKQLNSRRALLANYKEQIKHSEQLISRMEDSITVLKDELDEQTEAYYATVRKMYLWKKQQPVWLYYLSSTSANDLFRKWIYLNQLEDWQEARRREIENTRKKLITKRERAEDEKQQLAAKLAELNSVTAALDKDLNKEQELLSRLKSKEKELRSRLNQQVRERKKLETAIARIIEDARKEEKKDKKVAFAETPEGKAVSGAFANNKGKLPWPVKKGVVTRQFGKQKHPTLPNLYVQNNGVDIATERSALVRALFDGEVLGVVEVPGYQKMVIIQHGGYYTVYSRMGSVNVSKGDKVQTGSQIGQAFTDEKEGNTLVHLEIWQDKTKLDPIHWLVKH